MTGLLKANPLEVFLVSVQKLDAKRKPFGHRHLAGRGELGDALDFSEPLGAFRVIFQQDPRELGKRFHLNERTIEIEDVVPRVGGYR